MVNTTWEDDQAGYGKLLRENHETARRDWAYASYQIKQSCQRAKIRRSQQQVTVKVRNQRWNTK